MAKAHYSVGLNGRYSFPELHSHVFYGCALFQVVHIEFDGFENDYPTYWVTLENPQYEPVHLFVTDYSESEYSYE